MVSTGNHETDPSEPQARLASASAGQSLLEVAVFLPVLVLVLAYAVDFGYFFFVSANLASAARSAAEYSVQGYQTPSQGRLPDAGPPSSLTSVSALAFGDLGGLASSSEAGVEVCSLSAGLTNNQSNCVSFGPASSYDTSTATQVDPEAPLFHLNQVSVTYTLQPPIPLEFFSVSLLPSLTFHRSVFMRAMD